MKSAVIPQIRVEPELRAELESVLNQGYTLTDFIDATVRSAIAFRRAQTEFHARAQAARAPTMRLAFRCRWLSSWKGFSPSWMRSARSSGDELRRRAVADR